MDVPVNFMNYPHPRTLIFIAEINKYILLWESIRLLMTKATDLGSGVALSIMYKWMERTMISTSVISLMVRNTWFQWMTLSLW